MEWLGNVFTGYRYDTADMAFCRTGDALSVRSRKGALDVEVAMGAPEACPAGGLAVRELGGGTPLCRAFALLRSATSLPPAKC
jgi:hypothetical protein